MSARTEYSLLCVFKGEIYVVALEAGRTETATVGCVANGSILAVTRLATVPAVETRRAHWK